MATCSVQKQIRDEYDVFTESSQALKEQNWENFFSILGERASRRGPPIAAQREFFKKYVAQTPEVMLGETSTSTMPSDLVPIPNHVTRHSLQFPTNFPVASVYYTDIRKRWSIPFVSQSFTIFKGKQVTYNFYQTFSAVARIREGASSRTRSWVALARFAREEGKTLEEMGIEPKHLYFKGSWGEFATAMDKRAERFRRRALEAQSASSPKDSRRQAGSW